MAAINAQDSSSPAEYFFWAEVSTDEKYVIGFNRPSVPSRDNTPPTAIAESSTCNVNSEFQSGKANITGGLISLFLRLWKAVSAISFQIHYAESRVSPYNGSNPINLNNISFLVLGLSVVLIFSTSLGVG